MKSKTKTVSLTVAGIQKKPNVPLSIKVTKDKPRTSVSTEVKSVKVGEVYYLTNCKHSWNNGLKVKVLSLRIEVKALTKVDGPSVFIVGANNLTKTNPA